MWYNVGGEYLQRGETDMKRLFAMLLALVLLVPAACATTKEEIKVELGVFRVDELKCVTNIELLPDKDCPRFVLTMEEDMIMGGSEVSSDEWFTDGGIMCEADVDMDGDGTKEYVIAYARMSEDQYPEPELRLRIYARNGEEYALKGDLPLHWYWSNRYSHSYVRIVPQKKGAVIFSGGIASGDGASNYASVMVYGYDGKNCTVRLYANAVNYGDYLVIRDVRHPELLDSYLYLSAYDIADNPPDEDCDFGSPDESTEAPAIYGPMSTEGFDCINENLAKFGIKMQTSTFINEDWGYVKVDAYTGGKDFQFTCSNDDYNTLTFGMYGPAAEAQAEGLEVWRPKLSDDVWWEILPDSDERMLTKAELTGCDKELLGYIRNEILARHGYPFTKEKYQTYFGCKHWYEIDEEFTFGDLSDIENANIKLIQSLE